MRRGVEPDRRALIAAAGPAGGCPGPQQTHYRRPACSTGAQRLALAAQTRPAHPALARAHLSRFCATLQTQLAVAAVTCFRGRCHRFSCGSIVSRGATAGSTAAGGIEVVPLLVS